MLHTFFVICCRGTTW